MTTLDSSVPDYKVWITRAGIDAFLERFADLFENCAANFPVPDLSATISDGMQFKDMCISEVTRPTVKCGLSGPNMLSAAVTFSQIVLTGLVDRTRRSLLGVDSDTFNFTFTSSNVEVGLEAAVTVGTNGPPEIEDVKCQATLGPSVFTSNDSSPNVAEGLTAAAQSFRAYFINFLCSAVTQWLVENVNEALSHFPSDFMISKEVSLKEVIKPVLTQDHIELRAYSKNVGGFVGQWPPVECDPNVVDSPHVIVTVGDTLINKLLYLACKNEILDFTISPSSPPVLYDFIRLSCPETTECLGNVAPALAEEFGPDAKSELVMKAPVAPTVEFQSGQAAIKAELHFELHITSTLREKAGTHLVAEGVVSTTGSLLVKCQDKSAYGTVYIDDVKVNFELGAEKWGPKTPDLFRQILQTYLNDVFLVEGLPLLSSSEFSESRVEFMTHCAQMSSKLIYSPTAATGQDSSGGVTLDGAYDYGGPGAGRMITADAGAVTIAGDDGLVSTGTPGQGNIPATGPGPRMMWYPRKAAFRAGEVDGTQWDDANIGEQSIALGANVTASGNHSLATGRGTEANHDSASSFGQFTQAAGDAAMAMGFRSSATGRFSVASGYRTQASGINAVAVGAYTIAQAVSSFAGGRYNVAVGTSTKWIPTDPLFVLGNGSSDTERNNAFEVLKNGDTTIDGDLTVTAGAGAITTAGSDGLVSTGTFGQGDIPATGPGARMMWYPRKAAFRAGEVKGTQWDDDNIGERSIALGVNVTARGNHSVALGINNTASGPNSTAFGVGNVASGKGSYAMGDQTTASGFASMTMGYKTVAKGDKSWAAGNAAQALGSYAMAMGRETRAIGTSSSAMGYKSSASGPASLAAGYKTSASGSTSTALGDSTTAQAKLSIVGGRYNVVTGTTKDWIATDPLFVLGNGTSDSERSNAFEVLKNGNTTVHGDLTVTGACSGCASDLALKENVAPLEGALDKLAALPAVSFDWRAQTQEAELFPGHQLGVVAQDVETLFPELVGTDSRGYKYVDYQKLVVPLIAAVQELKAQNDAMKLLICADHPDTASCR